MNSWSKITARVLVITSAFQAVGWRRNKKEEVKAILVSFKGGSGELLHGISTYEHTNGKGS